MPADVDKVSTPKRYQSSGSYRLDLMAPAPTASGVRVSDQLADQLRDAAQDEINKGRLKVELARQMGFGQVQGLDAFLKGGGLNFAMAIRLCYFIDWDPFEIEELRPIVAPRGVVYPGLEATLEYLDTSEWSPAAILLCRAGYLGGDPPKEALAQISVMRVWQERLDLLTQKIEPVLAEIKRRIPV